LSGWWSDETSHPLTFQGLATYLSSSKRREHPMNASTTAHLPSPAGRIMRALPVIGRVIRDIEREIDTVYYLIVILLTALILAVQTWGLAALVVTAVALVPVVFVFLIWVTLP
jgi:hypothetical protein